MTERSVNRCRGGPKPIRREAVTPQAVDTPYAYPVNTINKPAGVARILEWAKAQHITGFGRWGTWDHMNSDIAVKNAIALGTATMDGPR